MANSKLKDFEKELELISNIEGENDNENCK